MKHPHWRRDVIFADLRNHGDSPHVDTMSYPEMADDILQLLDRLGIEKAALVVRRTPPEVCGSNSWRQGHSLGGKVAMSVALTNEERVDKLVVVDIAPINYPRETMSEVSTLVEHLYNMPIESFATRKDAEKWLAEREPVRLLLFVLSCHPLTLDLAERGSAQLCAY